jgi:hypothetical protein
MPLDVVVEDPGTSWNGSGVARDALGAPLGASLAAGDASAKEPGSPDVTSIAGPLMRPAAADELGDGLELDDDRRAVPPAIARTKIAQPIPISRPSVVWRVGGRAIIRHAPRWEFRVPGCGSAVVVARP